jgi:ABC-type transporter Mla subunit MlaD
MSLQEQAAAIDALTAQLNKSVNDASAVLEDKIALLRREARERDDAAQTRHAQFHSETLALLRKEAENRAETAKIRDVQQTFEMDTLRSNIAALNELLASRMAQLCDDFKVRDEQRASEIVQLRTDTQVRGKALPCVHTCR